MKAALLSIACAAFTLCAGADIVWVSSAHDFGVIREDAGPAAGSLSFVNIGPEPTVINNVRTSCGCTAARWPEGEIMPGDTAVIRFTYDPSGRPGRFEKTIRVTTGADNRTDVLKIRGNVIGDSATIARMYPYGSGPLRLTATDIQLGRLDFGAPRNQFIYAFNTSQDPVVLKWGKLPAPVTVGLSSDTIQPGQTASIGLYYNSRDESEMGARTYNLELTAAAPRMSYLIPLRVSVDLIPVVSMTPVAVAEAGRIHLARDIEFVGEVKPGKSVKFKFKISNGGKEKLDVTRVYTTVPGIRLRKYPRSIKPGGSSAIEGTYTPPASAPEGAFSHKITILSTDPVHPVENVRLSGMITGEPQKK